MRFFALVFLYVVGIADGFGSGCPSKPSRQLHGNLSRNTDMPNNFKVVFFGDQQTYSQSKAVLRMIKDFNASMVIHSGDLDYHDSPEEWDQQINDILGPNFPYFHDIGNHDIYSWDDACISESGVDFYGEDVGFVDGVRSPTDCCNECSQQDNCNFWTYSYGLRHCYLKSSDAGRQSADDRYSGKRQNPSTGYELKGIERLQRFGGDLVCEGEYGVNLACNYNGFLFVMSGIGTRGNDHSKFIDETFKKTNSVWKFCSWHKNQRLFQTGYKSDETGYEVYDTCREHGAIVVTAHEHSYSRTKNMADFSNQTIANEDLELLLKPQQSFAFVSGLGGIDVRSWQPGMNENTWWAATAASDNGVSFGALFCTFNIGGDLSLAHCDFKDMAENTWDSFDIRSENEPFGTKLAQHTPRSQQTKWLETTIVNSSDDADIVSYSPFLVLGTKTPDTSMQVVTLRFTNLPIQTAEVDQIKHAYLQLYVARAPVSNINITIRGQFTNTESVISTTESIVVWSGCDMEESWAKHDVVVSPDVGSIVKEMLRISETLTFLLESQYANPSISFYSFDHSPCMSPTLAFDLM